jgi:hypothetical protein
MRLLWFYSPSFGFLFFDLWWESVDGRYTGQVGGEKMGGKLAVAESTNGIQFTRTDGLSLSPSFTLFTPFTPFPSLVPLPPSLPPDFHPQI